MYMNYVALLYFAAMLAGFALIFITTTAAASFLAPFANVLVGIGAIAVILFAIAILYLAFRALFRR